MKQRADANSAESPKGLALTLAQDQWRSLPGRFGATLALCLSLGIAAILPAQFFRVFSTTLVNPSAQTGLGILIGLGVTVAVVQLLAGVAGSLTREWLSFHVEGNLRRKVFTRLTQVSLTTIDGPRRGEWQQRVAEDLTHTEQFLSRRLPTHLEKLGVVLGVTVLFLTYGGGFALLPLVGALLTGIGAIYLEQKNEVTKHSLTELHAEGARLIQESLEGVRTIRSHGAEPHLQKRFETHLHDLTQVGLGAGNARGWLIGGRSALIQLWFTACIGLAAWGVGSGQLAAADALVYPFFLALLFSAAQSLGKAKQDWVKFQKHGDRLGELLMGLGPFGTERCPQTPTPCFKEARAFQLEQLEIGVAGQTLAGPVSLTLPRGEVWAVMGPSGCGKSAFLETLAGIRPGFAGSVRFISGSRQTLWSGDSPNLMVPTAPSAYVEKNPYLFEGSFRDNLTLGNSNPMSDAMLWQFLEQAGLYHFVRKNGGLDRSVFSKRPLRPGERYRLALCRALMLQRPFLLLDEPFAGLDETSLELILGTIEFQKNLSGILFVTQFLPENFSVDGILSFEHKHGEPTHRGAPSLKNHYLA